MRHSIVPVIAGVLAVAVTASVTTAEESAQGYSQSPSGSTASQANQRSGQSGAAKHNAIVPEKSVTGGGGQSSSGEATQIEQSAKPLKLSGAQRQKIKSYFADNSPQRLKSVDFLISIGSAVPRKTKLHKLPVEISSALGGFQGDDYVLVGHQLVVIDNNARRIVAIIPGVV